MATISDSTLAKVIYKLVREDLGEKNFTRAEAAEVAEDAKDYGWRSAHAAVEIPGYGDWIIAKDGHELAVEYVEQSFEDDPESFKGFLQNYMTMDDTTRGVMAAEEADFYTQDLTTDDLDIDGDDDVIAAHDAADAAHEAVDDYEWDDDIDEDVQDAEYAELEKVAARLDGAVTDARNTAEVYLREKAYDDHYNYIYDELADPVHYFMDRFGEIPENILSVDVAAAAEDAVSSDGAGSWLSSYDGNEYEIKVGSTYYSAFRTN